MNNLSSTRFGGYAAFVSALLYIASVALAFSSSTAGVGTILYILSSLAFLVTIGVLYLDLRSVSQPIALAGTLLLALLTVWSMFLDPTEISPVFGPLTLAYGIGYVLVGWLQRQHPTVPNGLGLLAIATGVIALIASIALMAGAGADIFGLLNLILSLPYLVWLFWLGRLYLAGAAPDGQAA